MHELSIVYVMLSIKIFITNYTAADRYCDFHLAENSDIIVLCKLYSTSLAVADPEGVRRVQTNPLLSLNYFIFMGNFRKN